MTPAEQYIADLLERNGFDYVHSGWPDFIAVKDGKVQVIEVKTGQDEVRPNQAKCHAMLEQAGLLVNVLHISDETLAEYKWQQEQKRKASLEASPEVMNNRIHEALEQAFAPIPEEFQLTEYKGEQEQALPGKRNECGASDTDCGKNTTCKRSEHL